MHNQKIIREVKLAARELYSFPGGYALNVRMADGELMHAKCARDNFALIARATRDEPRDQWTALGVEAYWEGPDEYCCQCNEPIVSEYGDPDEDNGNG